MTVPSKTKTQYYLNQASDRGTTDTIEEYLDPIGFKGYFSQTRSFWFNITSDAELVMVDLSLLKLLVNNKSVGRISGGHEYEAFVKGDSKMKSMLSEMVEEMNERIDAESSPCPDCGTRVPTDETSCPRCGTQVSH